MHAASSSSAHLTKEPPHILFWVILVYHFSTITRSLPMDLIHMARFHLIPRGPRSSTPISSLLVVTPLLVVSSPPESDRTRQRLQCEHNFLYQTRSDCVSARVSPMLSVSSDIYIDCRARQGTARLHPRLAERPKQTRISFPPILSMPFECSVL